MSLGMPSAPSGHHLGVTALGSLPYPAGESGGLGSALELYAETVGRDGVLPLPERSSRGPGSQLVGRTGALLSGLGVELVPSGWRLCAAPGPDQRRAAALLRQDLDELEEFVLTSGTEPRAIKIAMAGPWTMAACIERPRGDRVIADAGATRDLGQSLAQGLADLDAELARRLPGLGRWWQLDEPMIAMVLDGSLAIASGLHRHAAIDRPRVAEALGWFTGVAPTVHWCAESPDFDLLGRAGIGSVTVDVAALAGTDQSGSAASGRDGLAAWLEAGHRVVWGVAGTQIVDQVGSVQEQTRTMLWLWTQLGLAPELLQDHWISPTCGLGLWQWRQSREVLADLAPTRDEIEQRLFG